MSLASAYGELTKSRLSTLVVLTTGAGFVLGSGETIRWTIMVWTMIGTALCAAAAAILNELSEIDRDRRMHRTQSRPLVIGRISQIHAMLLAVVLGAIGLSLLDILVNTFAAVLALACLVIYVAIYTPLKPRSTLNTLVGAICGALPPMIGWVGATGQLDVGAWILGGILYVWQIPHFLALAWLYREDYRRGGFAMLPNLDPHGEITSRVVVLTSLILLPLALGLTLQDSTGLVFAWCSVVLALGMVALAIRFHMNRTNIDARRVFLASITYLPIMLILMVVDRVPHYPHSDEIETADFVWTLPASELDAHAMVNGTMVVQPVAADIH